MRGNDGKENIPAWLDLYSMNVSGALGVRHKYTATHKRRGRLISRQANMPPPPVMTCPQLSCYRKFIRECIKYDLLLQYHRERTSYAEAYPDEHIKWKYRTGEDPPEGIRSSIWELIKLRTRRKLTWLKVKK